MSSYSSYTPRYSTAGKLGPSASELANLKRNTERVLDKAEAVIEEAEATLKEIPPPTTEKVDLYDKSAEKIMNSGTTLTGTMEPKSLRSIDRGSHSGTVTETRTSDRKADAVLGRTTEAKRRNFLRNEPEQLETRDISADKGWIPWNKLHEFELFLKRNLWNITGGVLLAGAVIGAAVYFNKNKPFVRTVAVLPSERFEPTPIPQVPANTRFLADR